MRIIVFLILFLLTQVSDLATAQDENASTHPQKASSLTSHSKGLPTYIKSNSLQLNMKERIFTYTGSVEVKQGDLTMYSDSLTGHYDENDQIQEMLAKDNVLILKGANIRATGGQATYNKAQDTLLLTENPELTQDKSILSADAVRIFLSEDRSIAEGKVRVKLVEENEKDKPRKLKP